MIINNETYPTLDVFENMMTVPDCFVLNKNKLGGGHGEKKFYICSKQQMREFYGDKGFSAKCFLLKKDLLTYMNAIKFEYEEPSQEYVGKNELKDLWYKRYDKIKELDDVIFFTIYDQVQIAGPRGYINSDDSAYNLIREISLPLVSYIYVEKIGSYENPLFYWRLFVDFDTMNEKQSISLVFKYGNKQVEDIEEEENLNKDKNVLTEIRKARVGQGKYREKLIDELIYCPFTKITDSRLLIASHIKPWAVSNDFEKIDHKNGYLLSPMFDKLFDKGFITFTKDRKIHLSNVISPQEWKKINIQDNKFIQDLPMDEERINYLKFHQESVFKGNLNLAS